MGTFLLVCVCGGLGAVARFMLNTSIQRWWHRAYPLSTFVINIIAAICAGIAAAAYFYQTVSYSTYLLFVAGFLGGFSTFSTAVNEMVSLTRTRQLAVAAFYFLTTLVVPFGAVVLGWFLGSIGH